MGDAVEPVSNRRRVVCKKNFKTLPYHPHLRITAQGVSEPDEREVLVPIGNLGWTRKNEEWPILKVLAYRDSTLFPYFNMKQTNLALRLRARMKIYTFRKSIAQGHGSFESAVHRLLLLIWSDCRFVVDDEVRGVQLEQIGVQNHLGGHIASVKNNSHNVHVIVAH
jgi:hypothetical protein